MDGHPNATVVREGLKAYTRGDLTRLTGLFADVAVWHAMGPKGIAGNYEGRDAIFEFFARVLDETGGTFRIQVHDVAASEDHAYAAVLTSGTRDGRVLEAAREVFVCHLREGMVTEVWDVALDQSAVNEFWA